VLTGPGHSRQRRAVSSAGSSTLAATARRRLNETPNMGATIPVGAGRGNACRCGRLQRVNRLSAARILSAMISSHVDVQVDLDRVRANAERIRANTRVPLIAVIKADAYGLGAHRVADALAAVVDDFAYFSIEEARRIRRPGLVLGPVSGSRDAHAELRLRAAIGDRDAAETFRGAPAAVSVDTGMQRFGCEPEHAEALARRCGTQELFTHARGVASARTLRAIGYGERIHAAASSLLDCEEARLDAVRPGVALYRGALRVTTRLVAVRETRGPAGYTGFTCPRVGVILAGYAQRLAPAPVVVSGAPQRIVEVGMNTAFVSAPPEARVGDPVTLLGDGLDEEAVAAALAVRPHEVLCRYGMMGARRYLSGDRH